MQFYIIISLLLFFIFGCSHFDKIDDVNSIKCNPTDEKRAPTSAVLCSDLFEKNESERDKLEKDRINLNLYSPKPFYFQMKFNKILPGQFEMLNNTGPNPIVKITIPFEMAQTETTQLQWSVVKVLLGEKNPDNIYKPKFNTDRDTVNVLINDIKVEIKPDHPIENVSYEEVIEWIQGLNRLSLSIDEKIQEQLLKVIPSHQKGHVYDLPTEAQWAFVAQNRGKNNNIFFDRNDSLTLGIYAWYSPSLETNKNANLMSAQKVATKKPRLIDSGNGDLVPFFDTQGNVGEWTKDWFALNLSDGDDPQGPSTGNWRVIRGGGYTKLANDLRLDFRNSESPLKRLRSVGFRLIRLIP